MVWRPNLAIIGAEAIPNFKDSKNVIRPQTKLQLSMRLCPAFDVSKAKEIIFDKLTKNVPYNASVKIENYDTGFGWSMNFKD
jgi:hypothetical protein